MTSEELREKYKKLLMVDMIEEHAIKATDVLLSLIKQGIEEAEPKFADTLESSGYWQGVSDYKSNLLQMVEEKKI